ncbi:lysophosphatidic acid receptor 6-like [Seriola dumerili]|nr:lysophosphatidic acid receptor 6-like [Seriola dumerili]
MENKPGPQPVYAVTFGCLMVIGLTLNAVSLWILLRRHSIKTTSAVFMVNLAISDLQLVISLPMRVYFYATGIWPLSARACNLITMLFCNNIRSSSIFITFISMDRLLAVVFPLRSRHLRTSSNAWKAAVLIWLFVFMVNIPESMSLARVLSQHNGSVCFDMPHYDGPGISPFIYFVAVLLLIMLAVNIVCTALVSWTLRRRLNESARIRNKVNVMLIFAMNLIMFIICFLPLTIGLVVSKRKVTHLTCLATVNCCLDPLLYYFSLDAFWKKKQDVHLPREQ